MIAPALALLLSSQDVNHNDCLWSPARATCLERKAAHDRGDFDQVEELIGREVEEVLGAMDGVTAPLSGLYLALCLPLEAGFNICDRRPERACARSYLDRYREVGCLEGPLQRPRYHTMLAREARRGWDDAAALEHLRRGEAEAWLEVWRRWQEPVRDRLLRTIADSMATRAEIAAHLRHPEVLAELVGWIELIFVGMEDADRLSIVADIRNQLGWALLLAHEAGLDAPEPRRMLRAALRTFEIERRDTAKAGNVRINLALAELQRDDPGAAQEWIAKLSADRLSREERIWLKIVQIRSALAERRFDRVAEQQRELDSLAGAGDVPLAAWLASATRGRVEEALGRPESARIAYVAAEADLERNALNHAGAHRALLADRRYFSLSEATQRLVFLDIEAGDDEHALDVVRRARTRALRMVARESCDDATRVEERDPGPSELRLFYFPLSGRRGGATTQWAGFVVTAQSVRAEVVTLSRFAGDLHRSDDELLRALSDELLEPFREEIDAARRIEILPTGAVHGVPFHALPWNGGILLDHASIIYGLDLATCGDDAGTPQNGALVLRGDDPAEERDMDAIRREVEAVHRALEVSGRPLTVLQPRDPRDLDLPFMGAVSLLHVAAHGTRIDAPELLRSDDRILFQGLSLTREAVLEARRAPAFVFLTSCLSSAAEAESLGGGVSLAQAFLLRGSRFVIAATDQPSGAVVNDVASAFYDHLGDGEIGDIPDAWRAAYLEVHEARRREPSAQTTLRMLRLHGR